MGSLHTPITTNRRLTSRESKEIAQAAASGGSITAIAARFAVSRPTVYRAIEKERAAAGQGHPAEREARVSARLKPYELTALDVLAGRHGVSRAELSRRVLRRAAEFLEPEPELIEAVRDLANQIKLIGGNLNQIATHLNRDARFHGRASLSAAQWQRVEGHERDLKALARELDGLFVTVAKRRKARIADIMLRVAK